LDYRPFEFCASLSRGIKRRRSGFSQIPRALFRLIHYPIDVTVHVCSPKKVTLLEVLTTPIPVSDPK
jgi:hypothetical protein